MFFTSFLRSLAVACLLWALPAAAADIATFGQARDRLLAQDSRAGEAEASLSADATLRTGSVELLLDGQTVRLGDGPGWLFGLAVPIGEGRTLYRLALVRTDGAVTFRAVQSLPAGLSPVGQEKKSAAAPAPVDSPEAAEAALVDRLLGHSLQGRRVFAAKAAVADPAVTVALWRGEVTLSGGPGWLFFVDDIPQANWEHACRYVLVAKTGEMQVVAARTPPRDMTAFTELTVWPSPGAASGLRTAVSMVASGAAKGATDPSHRYAVIISGGANAGSNYPRYWNDCSLFFTALKAAGFTQENIYVLISNGTDPTPDKSDGTKSNLDLNNDGINDIRFSATKANITAVFNELAGKLGSQDILYLFTTDHGGAATSNPSPYNNTDVVLWLWNDESISNAEFATEVNKVTTKATVGIFEQCFSGGMIETLRAPNRVFLSASRFWELSYAMNSQTLDYDEFSYYATQALADPTKGDSNGDGIVTLEEAYLYALAKDSYQSEELSGSSNALENTGEHPSYYSNPWDLGRKLALGGAYPTAKAPAYAGYSQYQIADAFPTGGTAQNWKGTDQYWTHTLPFAFPFNGTSYTAVTVSTNGIVYFANPSTSGLNSIDGLKAAVAVAPLWDWLSTSAAGDDITIQEDAGSAAIVWKAHTLADTVPRPVNTAVRLFPSGAIRFYYGPGNQHTSLVAQRDKTIGVSLGDSANAKYHFALRNGAPELGDAKALAILPGSMPPPVAGLPWETLLLQ